MSTVHSLPIAGMHGGSFIIGGFAGAVGAPVPPTVSTLGTFEAGNGTIVGMHSGNVAVLMGPIQTPVRQAFREVVSVAGTDTFNLDYQFSDDGGVTWKNGKQVNSAAVTVDGGRSGYTQAARILLPPGFQWRVIARNTSANIISIAYEKRLLTRGKRSN